MKSVGATAALHWLSDRAGLGPLLHLAREKTVPLHRHTIWNYFGVDFRNYVILGACNPSLAYQTLQEELGIRLLLPCNVVVYEQGGRSVVAAIDAVKMLSVVGNPSWRRLPVR